MVSKFIPIDGIMRERHTHRERERDGKLPENSYLPFPSHGRTFPMDAQKDNNFDT